MSRTDVKTQSLDLVAFPNSYGKDSDERVAKPTAVRCLFPLEVRGWLTFLYRIAKCSNYLC